MRALWSLLGSIIRPAQFTTVWHTTHSVKSINSVYILYFEKYSIPISRIKQLVCWWKRCHYNNVQRILTVVAYVLRLYINNNIFNVCLESRSSCGGGGGSEGSEGRASWRVTLDHDLVETLSAIYPEWFKPQQRRERSRAASPVSPASPPRTPATPPSDDTFR